jgi:membrane-associated protease RseP (regulator of RpoE activity)
MMYDTVDQGFVDELRAQLDDVFLAEDVTLRGDGRVVTFAGRLLRDAESAFAILEERLKSLGFLPLLSRNKGQDMILVAPAPAEKRGSRPMVNLGLFLATVGTVILAGALQEGYNPFADPPLAILTGVPFAVALLGILVTHELAHFFVATARGMKQTLPYFIPIPFSPVGTFGAVIRMESPIRDRKALFDVGISGPLAGLVVSLIALVVGLRRSEIVALAAPPPGTMYLGSGILVEWLTDLVVGPLPHHVDVLLDPVAFAGWFGVFITAMNLIPLSQLDGGHVGYAFFGKRHRIVAILVFVALLAMALFWTGWLIWAFFILIFGGLRHPPPLNDITPLDRKRKILGIFCFVLLFLLATPRPFG